jgi:hypothetical protein
MWSESTIHTKKKTKKMKKSMRIPRILTKIRCRSRRAVEPSLNASNVAYRTVLLPMHQTLTSTQRITQQIRLWQAACCTIQDLASSITMLYQVKIMITLPLSNHSKNWSYKNLKSTIKAAERNQTHPLLEVSRRAFLHQTTTMVWLVLPTGHIRLWSTPLKISQAIRSIESPANKATGCP